MAVRIQVTVKPQAKQESVSEIQPGRYQVSVKAPPVDGRANTALIEVLARHFAVRKSAIRIVAGKSARRKIIEIGE